MKTAEDFRKELGEVEASFERRVRQTLTVLECEEEKPVKKKISLSLVLAMTIMLLTVGAVAAGQWGILDFAKEHGEKADPDRLVTEMDQGTYKLVGAKLVDGKSELVHIELEEILYEDGWLYAAMMVKPKQEKTMVIADEMQEINEHTGNIFLNALGKIRDINEPGSMKNFVEGTELDPEMSVKEYADSMGFEHVVRVALGMFIKHADYELLEDGSLRMIVQMEYNYYQRENYPVQMTNAFIPVDAVQYDEDGKLPENFDANNEFIEVQAVGLFLTDSRTKRSIPEDAHQIEGYRGYIESVFVTPLSEDEVSVIIQLDQQKRHYGVTQMSGPVVVILDENGEALYECDLYRDIDSMVPLTDDRIQHNIVMPAAGLSADKITIRLQSWRNSTTIYDEYTYTLE